MNRDMQRFRCILIYCAIFKRMKKTVFTILWMLAFCIVGICIFAGFSAAIVLFLHHPYNEALDKNRILAVMVVDWLGPIGLPILALILGIRGALPGTRSKKQTGQL